jgi:uncharacterized protein YfaP (DUF2135 family)
MVWHELALARPWDSRYGDFGRIHRMEYRRFLQDLLPESASPAALAMSRRRLEDLSRDDDPRGLVVLISWNTDRTDVDLHVTDPSGEECYYQNRETKLGGRLTRDVTEGFGPEMFALANPAPGEYRIDIVNYSDDANRLSGLTEVLVTIWESRGNPDERMTRGVVSLAKSKERTTVARVVVR